jgi:hypothetical protein
MDASALASAESWLSLIGTAKLIAAFLVALGVAIEFGGDWIAKPFEKTVSDARNLQLATLQKAADEARAGIANAQEETAKANKATEELRQKNLELEQAVAPRVLNEVDPDGVLAGFAGQIVQIDAIPDFEAQRLAGGLGSLLKRVGWDIRLPKPNNSWLGITEGVRVEICLRAGKDPPDPNQSQRRAAAEALIDALKKQNIDATLAPRPTIPQEEDALRASGIIIESIRVTVGSKPSRYFLEQRYPWMKEQREGFEQRKADSDRKFDEMKKRANEALERMGRPPLPDDPR